MRLSLVGQKDNFLLVTEAWNAAKRACDYYGGSRFSYFVHALQFTLRTRMRPGEALEYGVFSPEGKTPSDYLSKRTCSDLQRKLNPPDWFWVTEDKGIFNSFCEGYSIPVPKCRALLFRDASGLADGQPVRPDSHSWAEALAGLDLNRTVIKPCRHSYGRGLFVPKVSGAEIKAAGRTFTSLEDMTAYMVGLPELGSWIVQERVRSHPDLASFSGTNYLQTMRIYSHVDGHGNVHIIDGFLKVIGGDAVIDNFQHGTLGNFIAPIDIETGGLKPAITRGPDMRWTRIDAHPKTGNRFEAFTLPCWTEAKELVLKSAGCFKPIRSLGWDIGITPDGPVVIEANIRWDPPNWNAEMVHNVRRVLEQPENV